jgi:hypothetical protein
MSELTWPTRLWILIVIPWPAIIFITFTIRAKAHAVRVLPVVVAVAVTKQAEL